MKRIAMKHKPMKRHPRDWYPQEWEWIELEGEIAGPAPRHQVPRDLETKQFARPAPMESHFSPPLGDKNLSDGNQEVQGREPLPSSTQSTDLSGSAYVHDPESLYNEVGQDQFLRTMLTMQLNHLTFPALSQLVRQLLLRSGYSSVRSCGEGQNRKTWGEGGLELLAFSHTDLSTTLTAIQLKQHREPVPRRFVDELRGVMLRLRADSGLIVATAPFSALAREAASEPGLPPVHLIDAAKLTAMLLERRLGLRAVRQDQDSSVRHVFDAEFFAGLEAATGQKGKNKTGASSSEAKPGGASSSAPIKTAP